MKETGEELISAIDGQGIEKTCYRKPVVSSSLLKI